MKLSDQVVTSKTPTEQLSGERPLQCTFCHRTFKKKSHLTVHEHIHSRESPYRCECGKSFNRKNHLTQHKLTHTEVKPYRCDICNNSYFIKGRLERHKLTHSTAKFEGSECNRNFQRQDTLMAPVHLHTGMKPFQCAECGKSFFQRHDLVVHLLSHTEVMPYKCDKCNSKYTTSSNYRRHKCSLENIYKTETSVDSRTQCPYCIKTFNKKSNLKRHKTTCKISSSNYENHPQVKHKCSECLKTFSTIGNLSSHIRNYHKELNEIKKDFVAQQVDKDNLIEVPHKTNRNYKDGDCKDNSMENVTHENDLNYTANNEYTKYSSTRKKFKGPYECGECRKTFLCPARLFIHAIKHPSLKPYKCCKCYKAFSKQKKLDKHICCSVTCSLKSENSLTEHFDKPNKINSFSCHCGPFFGRCRKLINHLKSLKTAETYKIPKCPETFGTQINLSAQNRNCNVDTCENGALKECNAITVTNEVIKPYQCNICYKGYISKSAMTRHRKEKYHEVDNEYSATGITQECSVNETQEDSSQHSEEKELSHEVIRPYQCEICNKGFVSIKMLNRHRKRHELINEDYFRSSKHHVCECGESFINHIELGIHQRSHVNLYKCLECYETFSTEERFAQHNGIFHETHSLSNDNVGNVSKKSDKKFDDFTDDLNNRKKIIKPNEYAEVVDTSQEYENNYNFNDHVTQKSKRPQCQNCKRIFRRKRDKSKHERICDNVKEDSNDRNKLFKPNDYAAVSEDIELIVSQRIEIIHKSLSLSNDSTETVSQENEKNADNVTDDLKDENEVCKPNEYAEVVDTPKESKENYNLNDNHVTQKSKRSQCQKCNRKFRRKCNKYKHERICEGQKVNRFDSALKPYKCLECYENFSSKCNLAMHKKNCLKVTADNEKIKNTESNHEITSSILNETIIRKFNEDNAANETIKNENGNVSDESSDESEFQCSFFNLLKAPDLSSTKYLTLKNDSKV